jgi:isoamylase
MLRDALTCDTNAWHAQFGSPWPLGVRWLAKEKAFNFAIYSKHATRVELHLFRKNELESPLKVVNLDPRQHKSGPIWHTRLKASAISEAKYYAYRVDGPLPSQGYELHQFDSQKLLLDPYVRDVFFPPGFSRQAAILPGDNLARAPLGVLPKIECDFNWGNDERIRHGSDLVIYELHVRGFTFSDSSGIAEHRRGTFLGIIDKIPYLQRLGVTAVELMPVFQFDPQEGNYWGYMPLSFFAPHEAYASASALEDQHTEFREMVKQLHLAGLEVILDVVYNHTCESNETGPTYSYKGIDATTYYIMSGDVRHPYLNYSGTGNTLHTVNRATRQLIVDSLRYWVKEMHVDGFRFDLASIFMRGEDGNICAKEPPIFGQIAADPDLAGIRLIAEPWDAGAYALGRGFPGTQWMQWNSAYQSCLHRFVRGDFGQVPELMTRLHGSQDIFPDDCIHSLRPFQSVNYINSHDGFTLYDLVSYNEPHNAANGHGGRDGQRESSWNCGTEGDTDVSQEVEELRIQQAKNFFTLLMLSAGTPMFRMGDEFLQTQFGNNNPYNQDNESSWLDWSRAETFSGFLHFCTAMIAFRKSHSSLCRTTFWHEAIRWYGTEHIPDLSYDSKRIAFCLHGTQDDPYDLYVMINGGDSSQLYGVFERAPGEWRGVIDTSRECENVVKTFAFAPTIVDNYLAVNGRSIVVLQAAILGDEAA